MSLEAYTGKIKDLVITNPTPTDPKSQGDDHLRGIKKTMFDDAVRVSGSPLQQMGDKATAGENHYWDASTANQLSLKRGTPEAPGAELIKALNGVLSFPNQGQLLEVNGYVKLPGGLIIQWGTSDTGTTGRKVTPFPIPFPTKLVSLQCTIVNEFEADTFVLGSVIGVYATSLSQFVFGTRDTANVWIADRYFGWIAIGY